MQAVNDKPKAWDKHLSEACWVMRSTYNEAIKKSPFEVMLLRKPRFTADPVEHDYERSTECQPVCTSAIEEYMEEKGSQAVELREG